MDVADDLVEVYLVVFVLRLDFCFGILMEGFVLIGTFCELLYGAVGV